MKKIIIAAIALGLIGSTAQAQSNQVLSRNAVGYVKMSFPKGLSIIQNVFDPLGAPIAISNTFSGLPTSSRISVWNGVSYDNYNKTLGGWGVAGSNTLKRGTGFWVYIPNAAASNAYTVYMMGEVPDDTTTVVAVQKNLNLVGSPYPVVEKWTNTVYAKVAQTSSRLSLWDGTNYVNYNRTLAGWGAATNVVLTPGQGFWVYYAGASFPSATNLNLVKPYTWP